MGSIILLFEVLLKSFHQPTNSFKVIVRYLEMNPEKSPQTETHTCSPELPPQPTTRDGELARTDRETQTDTLPPVEPASPVVNGAVVELDAAVVPTVRVWLSQTVRVPANQNAVVPVGKCARRIPTPDAASGDVPKPGGWPRLCLRISR